MYSSSRGETEFRRSVAMDPSNDSSSRVETELDPNLWRNLPHTLWQSVIPFLPFSVLLQFRLVCHSWNELITTPSFAMKCARSAKVFFPGRKLFLKDVPLLSPDAGVREVAIYRCCPIRCKWEKFLMGGELQKARTLIVCSGGLLCFEAEDPDRYIICNPLTKRSRGLECPFKVVSSGQSNAKESGSVRRIVGLVVDTDTGNYKLVIVSLGVGGVGRTTCIYDSATCAWKTGTQVTRFPNDEEETFVSAGAVTCDGSIYCMLSQYPAMDPNAWKWRLLQYKVETDCWSHLFIDLRDYMPTQIVEVGGEILVVFNVALRKWLPSGAYQTIWYHGFHPVLSEDGQDMSLRQPTFKHSFPRTIIRRLLQQKENRPYTTMCCTFAGGNDEIYFTHQYESDDPERRPDDTKLVTVGRFDVDRNAFLPTFDDDGTIPCVSGETDQVGVSKRRMKIWMLHPSFTAVV